MWGFKTFQCVCQLVLWFCIINYEFYFWRCNFGVEFNLCLWTCYYNCFLNKTFHGIDHMIQKRFTVEFYKSLIFSETFWGSVTQNNCWPFQVDASSLLNARQVKKRCALRLLMALYLITMDIFGIIFKLFLLKVIIMIPKNMWSYGNLFDRATNIWAKQTRFFSKNLWGKEEKEKAAS